MHELYKQNNLPYMAVKLCPNCEKLIKVDSNVCPHCSYDFNNKIVMKQENSTVTSRFVLNKSNNVKPVEKEPVKVAEKFVFCEHCGSKIVGEQRFCSNCGTKASKRICNSCKQIIDSNLAFCPYCGEKQQGVVPQEVVSSGPIEQNSHNNDVVAPVVSPINQENVISNVGSNDKVLDEKKVNEDNNVTTVKENDNNNIKLSDDYENLSDCINMGRKRLFIIIQLIVTAIIATLMVMVPIITKDSLFTSLVPSFSGTLEDAKITLKDLILGLIEAIPSGSIFNEADPMYGLVNVDGNYIFSSMPGVNMVVSIVEFIVPGFFISLVSVALVYFLITLSMIIIFFSSIVGFFRKTPYRGKAMGSLTIMLLIGCLIVYLGCIIGPYNGYDSWLLYAFALTFLLWFIVKLVFGKEARIYKKLKEEGLE